MSEYGAKRKIVMIRLLAENVKMFTMSQRRNTHTHKLSSHKEIETEIYAGAKWV